MTAALTAASFTTELAELAVDIELTSFRRAWALGALARPHLHIVCGLRLIDGSGTVPDGCYLPQLPPANYCPPIPKDGRHYSTLYEFAEPEECTEAWEYPYRYHAHCKAEVSGQFGFDSRIMFADYRHKLNPDLHGDYWGSVIHKPTGLIVACSGLKEPQDEAMARKIMTTMVMLAEMGVDAAELLRRRPAA